jgi:hypothetical protein
MPHKKAARMGDVRKAVGCVPPTALLSLREPFPAQTQPRCEVFADFLLLRLLRAARTLFCTSTDNYNVAVRRFLSVTS